MQNGKLQLLRAGYVFDISSAVRAALRPRGNAAWKYRRERIRRRISALRERILRERDE